jgi:nicotinic acid mononucleotide adenylyltransferase
MKSFKEYLNSKKAVISFIRFNPPHKGYEQLFEFMDKYGLKKNANLTEIYFNHSKNEKKNPLSYEDKIEYAKKIIPKNVSISENTSFKNVYQIMEHLIKDEKYNEIYFIVGEDKIHDFESLHKYVNEWSNGEVLLKIVNSGNRVQGISGSDMRIYAKENNFKNFKNILPNMLQESADELFQKTREGLGIINNTKKEQ